jgi:hypothetical protein
MPPPQEEEHLTRMEKGSELVEHVDGTGDLMCLGADASATYGRLARHA